MGSLTITATLEPKGPAAAFVLTEEQVRIVGEGAKRFPATTTIDGPRPRTTVAQTLETVKNRTDAQLTGRGDSNTCRFIAHRPVESPAAADIADSPTREIKETS